MKMLSSLSRGRPAWPLLLAAGWVILAAWPAIPPTMAQPLGEAPAAGRPDFSGVWRLDLRTSDFAGEAAPESKVQKVEQKEGSLLVTVDEVQAGRPVHGSSRYALDGRESVNEVFGNPLTSTVAWEDGTMVMRTWGSFGGAKILLVDRWSLSADGRTLTIARHFEGHGLTSDQRLVFEKQ